LSAAESLQNKIKELKEKSKAVILAHNYQLPEIQDIADYVGDSLGLSIEASKTKAKIIVFCGVDFMAETAAILCPDKTVLLPVKTASCPMANMINPEKLRKLKSDHPGTSVVCYVNSSAEIKAEADICCTSANAVNVVKSLSEKNIIFVPDKFLGSYVQSKLPDKHLILFDGYCPTHAKILVQHVQRAKKAYPQALLLIHPECRPEIVLLANAVLSTEGMLRFVKRSEEKEFIVGTENGIIYRMQKENPDKKFYPALNQALCPNMKLTTLEKILFSLEDLRTKINVPEPIRIKAKSSIDRMLAVGRQD